MPYRLHSPRVIYVFIAAYEKLVMYGVYVHCGIDGGSNFIVYAVVDVNKRAETLWRGYSEAVANFGRPAMLRADMAFEAQPIGQDMLNHRGPGTYISGPSTSNQVTNPVPFSFTLFALHSCTALTALQLRESRTTGTTYGRIGPGTGRIFSWKWRKKASWTG